MRLQTKFQISSHQNFVNGPSNPSHASDSDTGDRVVSEQWYKTSERCRLSPVRSLDNQVKLVSAENTVLDHWWRKIKFYGKGVNLLREFDNADDWVGFDRIGLQPWGKLTTDNTFDDLGEPWHPNRILQHWELSTRLMEFVVDQQLYVSGFLPKNYVSIDPQKTVFNK